MTARRMTWFVPAAILLLAGCSGSDGTEATPEANPCAANPCAANPCVALELPVDKIRQGDKTLDSHGKTNAQLVALGADLWRDASLSGTGATSCSTCHTGDGTVLMNPTFAQPYPHSVQMPKDQLGMDEVTAAEMVQVCMAIPMAADPFDYGAEELAALTAYTVSLQDGFVPSGEMNPCGANPCAANPCGANPCAANPCGG